MPCGCRVRVVHASLHGSRIEIAFTCCDTDLHESGSCFAAFVLQHGSCQPIHCTVSVVLDVVFCFPNPFSRPVAGHCSGSAVEPALVSQPWDRDVPTSVVEWSDLLSMSLLSFLNEGSEAASLNLPCDSIARCVRHIQSGQDLTRTPLYEALKELSSSFLAHVPSHVRHAWRAIRRALEHCVECAGIGHECYGVQRRRANAARTSFALASSGGQMIRRTRLPRALQSGPEKSIYSFLGKSSTQFPYASSPIKGVTHSWSSVAGLPPLNGLHAFLLDNRWQDFSSQDTIKCCLMLLFQEEPSFGRKNGSELRLCAFENHVVLRTAESSPVSSASEASSSL